MIVSGWILKSWSNIKIGSFADNLGQLFVIPRLMSNKLWMMESLTQKLVHLGLVG